MATLLLFVSVPTDNGKDCCALSCSVLHSSVSYSTSQHAVNKTSYNPHTR